MSFIVKITLVVECDTEAKAVDLLNVAKEGIKILACSGYDGGIITGGIIPMPEMPETKPAPAPAPDRNAN